MLKIIPLHMCICFVLGCLEEAFVQPKEEETKSKGEKVTKKKKASKKKEKVPNKKSEAKEEL